MVLKKQLENSQHSISIINSLAQSSSSVITFNHRSIKDHTIRSANACSKKKPSQTFSQAILQDPNFSLDEYTKVKHCLSTIDDPLWKKVCQDVIRMMGLASFLEIWECRLGEVASQKKHIDIYCTTEKEAQFIKQYSFVFLGSLKTYFPALKEINARIIFS
jgi:hypothetical protein